MRVILVSSVAAAALLTGCSSLPDGRSDEHVAHHPAAASSKPDTVSFDQQLSAMQSVHEQLHNAKTPEERAVLMTEHKKAMRDGMAMMGQMSGNMGMGGDPGTAGRSKTRGMATDPETMTRRMDMMEMMMRMMMDREAMAPPRVK